MKIKNKKQKVESPEKTKIEKAKYGREKQKVSLSPKQAVILSRICIGGLLILVFLLFAIIASGYQPIHTIITRDESSQSAKTGSVDYRAKAYMDSYVEAYFNVPKDEVGQTQYAKNLQVYSDGQLPTISQGRKLNPTKLINATLLDVTKDTVVYAVTYESSGKTHNTIFNIPYKKSGNTYVVNSQPYFTAVEKLQGKNENKVQLGATDRLEQSQNEALDNYVKSLFTAYTSSSNTLPLISKGLSLNLDQTFKSVDYTYYSKNKDGSFTATTQVTFENSMGTHAENWTFTIKAQGNSYFASNFKHVIEKNYITKGE